MRIKHASGYHVPKQVTAQKVAQVFDPLPRKATLRNRLTGKVIRVSSSTLDGLFRVIKNHPGFDCLS